MGKQDFSGRLPILKPIHHILGTWYLLMLTTTKKRNSFEKENLIHFSLASGRVASSWVMLLISAHVKFSLEDIPG